MKNYIYSCPTFVIFNELDKFDYLIVSSVFKESISRIEFPLLKATFEKL